MSVAALMRLACRTTMFIHGQLVVAGQAVLATDSARLTRDPDLRISRRDLRN